MDTALRIWVGLKGLEQGWQNHWVLSLCLFLDSVCASTSSPSADSSDISSQIGTWPLIAPKFIYFIF